MPKTIHFAKRVEIKIKCTNDAFVLERPEVEIIRILKEEINRLEFNNIDSKKLFDVNGNEVGSITVKR